MVERIRNMAEPGNGEGSRLYIADARGNIVGQRTMISEANQASGGQIVSDIQTTPLDIAAAKLQTISLIQPEFQFPLPPQEGQQLDMPGIDEAPDQEKLRLLQSATFKETLYFIDNLQQRPSSPERDWALERAKERRNQLLVEANERGLFDQIKDQLFDVYYNSRVGVTRAEKYGRAEYKGRGKLQELDTIINITRDDPQIWGDRDSARDALRTLQANGIFAGEERTRFWASAERSNLEGNYAGVVDYFNTESLKMIRTVVGDRHIYDNGEYPDNGLNVIDQDGLSAWNYTWKSDHERTYALHNFDDIRDLVETERKKKYFVPNRGDYESYIELVADDVAEVEESIPYILDAISVKFGIGEPDALYQTLEGEKTKIQKAVENFAYKLGYERKQPEYRKFRRLKSRLTSEINLLGAYEFSKLLHEDWGPHLKYLANLARGFQDTEYQDNIMDSVYLDNDGMTALALHLYEKNDGEFWRYGVNTSDTPKHMKIGDGYRWQEGRRKQIETFLVTHNLRDMKDLLGLEDETIRHPAFERLKQKLDALDQAEGGTPGVYVLDENGVDRFIPKTRWQEYAEKALQWQKDGIQGDIRDRTQRVLFQHPLARALTDEEFMKMFVQINETNMSPRDKAKLRLKRRKARSVMESAERMARSFHQDAAAGLARHSLTVEQIRGLGLPEKYEVARNENGEPILDSDNNPMPESVPHNVLLAHLLQQSIDEDARRYDGADSDSPRIRGMRFKITHVLKEILGIDRKLPVFSNWYLGAHDTLRPAWLGYIEKIKGFKDLLRYKNNVRALNRDDSFGGDEKVSLTRWVEEEREVVQAYEVYIRSQYGNFFNFPGHDTEGGGSKEARNLFLFPYGQSGTTVEVNSLIPTMWLGETDFLHSYGCTSWKELMGLLKGPDETVFMQSGSLFETPRDTEYWVKRVQVILDQQKAWTSGGKDGSHGVLNDGPVKGGYLMRALNKGAKYILDKEHHIFGTHITPTEFTAIQEPDVAYSHVDESTYESYVKLSAQCISPIMEIMESRLKLENVYGRSPGTAKFLNTLTWYAVSNWMDTNWEEFRGKLGLGLDLNLPMARKFMHTVLFESRLVFSDKEWDERMLGYTIPKEEWEVITHPENSNVDLQKKIKTKGLTKIIRYSTNADGKTRSYLEHGQPKYDEHGQPKYDGGVIEGETVEGILDAFPSDIRAAIISGKILPFGLNSDYPESLEMILNQIDVEGGYVNEVYGGLGRLINKTVDSHGNATVDKGEIDQSKLAKQIRRRIDVTRGAAVANTIQTRNNPQNPPSAGNQRGTGMLRGFFG